LFGNHHWYRYEVFYSGYIPTWESTQPSSPLPVGSPYAAASFGRSFDACRRRRSYAAGAAPMTSAAVGEPGWKSVPAMDGAINVQRLPPPLLLCRRRSYDVCRRRERAPCSSGRFFTRLPPPPLLWSLL